jgi:hypothetical protein
VLYVYIIAHRTIIGGCRAITVLQLRLVEPKQIGDC